MKIKRNKRVARSRRWRATVITRENQISPCSLRALRRHAYVSLRANMRVGMRRPKKALALLERDVTTQAERLQRLEETILTPLVHPRVVMVPLLLFPDETESQLMAPEESASEPEPMTAQLGPETQADERSDEEVRTNYQYVPAARRIRRRIQV